MAGRIDLRIDEILQNMFADAVRFSLSSKTRLSLPGSVPVSRQPSSSFIISRYIGR